MELYGSYTSPFVRHCRIALLQTKLKCKFVETDATQSATLSPTKKVPLLIDSELTLTDSTSILTHIHELVGEYFLTDVEDLELYHMSNTLLDTCVNLFMLANSYVYFSYSFSNSLQVSLSEVTPLFASFMLRLILSFSSSQSILITFTIKWNSLNSP